MHDQLMHTETVAIASLKLDPANARKHDEKNLAAIRGSLEAFGQQKPIIVSGDTVAAGNGTLMAAKELGWETIEVVRTELTGAELTAFCLADNRTSELAAWDDTVLGETLHILRELEFDLTSIGFDTSYLDGLNPTFDPATKDDQGRLDEKKQVECPECQHVFTP